MPVNLSNWAMPDTTFSASSSLSPENNPENGILLDKDVAWKPSEEDENPYLEVLKGIISLHSLGVTSLLPFHFFIFNNKEGKSNRFILNIFQPYLGPFQE